MQMVFLAESKMFASAHLSSAVVGINRDGRHHEPISLLRAAIGPKTHFVIVLFSLGSHYDHYNEVAVYFLWAMHYVFKLSVCLHTYLRACLMLESLTVLPSTSSFIFTLTHQDE